MGYKLTVAVLLGRLLHPDPLGSNVTFHTDTPLLNVAKFDNIILSQKRCFSQEKVGKDKRSCRGWRERLSCIE
jgi:hypothetical protein